MTDKLKQFISILKVFPVWLRALLLAFMCGIILICSLASCGQTVRVTVKDTPNGVSISTTQTKKDSSGTNINITPNINFSK